MCLQAAAQHLTDSAEFESNSKGDNESAPEKEQDLREGDFLRLHFGLLHVCKISTSVSSCGILLSQGRKQKGMYVLTLLCTLLCKRFEDEAFHLALRNVCLAVLACPASAALGIISLDR